MWLVPEFETLHGLQFIVVGELPDYLVLFVSTKRIPLIPFFDTKQYKVVRKFTDSMQLATMLNGLLAACRAT